jgi:hypothetical protein
MRNSRPSCFGSAYCGTKQEAIMRNSIGPPVLFHAYSTVQLCSYAAAYGSRESCFLRMHAAHTVVRLWLALPRLRPRRRGRHGRWGPQLKWASSTSRPSTSRSTSRRRPPREPQGSTAHAALRSDRRRTPESGCGTGAQAGRKHRAVSAQQHHHHDLSVGDNNRRLSIVCLLCDNR